MLSGILITLAELHKYLRGECTLNQTLTTISVKIGSRAAAISIASFVAVGICAAAGTLPVSGPFLAGSAVTGAIGSRIIADRFLRRRVPPAISDLVAAGSARLSIARRLSIKARSREMRENAGPVGTAVRAAGISFTSTVFNAAKSSAEKWRKRRKIPDDIEKIN